MTEASLPALVIVADAPDALVQLSGISLLERLRRVAINLGFREATVLSNSVASIESEIARQSWRAGQLSIQYRDRQGESVTVDDLRALSAARVLVVSASSYYDKRLLAELIQSQSDSLLIDSDPPAGIAPLMQSAPRSSGGWMSGAAVISRDWLAGKNTNAPIFDELSADVAAGRAAPIDAAKQSSYVPDMRRHVRPCFFPAPSESSRSAAERLLRDNTQKGALDFPAYVHEPIEKWLVSHVARTSITPNQITLATALLGLGVTILYASGNLAVGVVIALLIGVLDGVDGKLARLTERTTKIGEGEHALDYCLEMSWWAALAFHFHSTGQVPNALWIWLAFFVSDVVDRLAKWTVERRFGRKLDDLSRFDRFVRSIAGRRNIYTWLFAIFVLIGSPAAGFLALSFWGITSTAVHVFRAAQVRMST